VKDRDGLIAALAAKDIHCGIHYPIPLHLQEAYKSLGYQKGAFPVAEKAAAEFVSLPMYAELTGEQISRVVTELQAVVLAPVS
jgi:dTDP-4-amino-4,6-dideoxygalactose transaminase